MELNITNFNIGVFFTFYTAKLISNQGRCVFISSPVKEGSTRYGDHRGSILSNRAETSQEG